ncbi:pentapeptide repeat-containing protein [Brevibacillus centrosporus]|uniref:pentapeptide repeat-containing protein n=1 Tax=Brevibacillus centrosporus TaxID=54910 RepID=UPI00398718D2
MYFPTKPWDQMTESEHEFFNELSEEVLIERWNSEEGQQIRKKIIEVNFNKGKSKAYEDFLGTLKQNYHRYNRPKFDLRGIDLSDFSNLHNDDEYFSFDFSNCLLHYANFAGSEFAYSNFSTSNILYSDFSYAKLDGCNFSKTNLTFTDFSHSNLEHSNFKGAWMTSVKFNESDLGYIKFDNHTDFYNIETDGFLGTTNPLFIDLVRKKQYLKHFKEHSISNKIVYYIWKAISDCGQSFFRWFGWSIAISILFGYLYSVFSDSFIISSGRSLTPFSFYYYSIVTFSTLGYGDITPKTLFGEILVTIEVVLGYIMLGGLLSIFGDKFIPRK